VRSARGSAPRSAGLVGDDGQCIFGCEVGQDFTTERCYSDCSGFSPLCLTTCLRAILCIDTYSQGSCAF
jgi:hypothetical protein